MPVPLPRQQYLPQPEPVRSYLPAVLIAGGAAAAAIALLWREKHEEQQGIAAYWRLVEQAASEAGLDPAILGAVVYVESNWQNQNLRGVKACRAGGRPVTCQERFGIPCTVSEVNAIGLAQIKPVAAREVGFAGPDEGLCDPLTNLRMAARYLKKYLDVNGGDIRKTWATYNAGPGHVKRNDARAQQSYRTYVVKAAGAYKRYGGERSLGFVRVGGAATPAVSFFSVRA